MKTVFAGIVLAQTVFGQTYCTTGGNRLSGDSNLGAVTLAGINDDADCPGGTGVLDMTSQSANIQPGTSYTLNFQATTCGAGFPRAATAWIDFNGNGEWEDSEKLGFESIDNSVAPQDIAMSFDAPCDDAASGAVRMRVVVVESASTINDACADFSYGGAKDFTVNLASGCNSNGVAGGGIGGGSIFLIILLVLVLLYTAIGCWYMRAKRGTTGMKESCFGIEYIAGFFGLAKDGCMQTKNFIQAKITGKSSSSYEDLDDV